MFKQWVWRRLKKILRRLGDVDSSLATITAQLQTIQKRLGVLMAVTEDTKALVAKLNDATNTVAAEIQTLKAKIPAPGTVIDATAAQEIDTGLQGVIDRLNSFGQDPNNPIPPAPPPAPTPPPASTPPASPRR